MGVDVDVDVDLGGGGEEEVEEDIVAVEKRVGRERLKMRLGKGGRRIICVASKRLVLGCMNGGGGGNGRMGGSV